MSHPEADHNFEAIQTVALLARLNEANNRIATLEREVRAALREKDQFGQQIATRLRELARANDGHNMFPAYEISQILEFANVVERERIWKGTTSALEIEGAIALLAPHDNGDGPLNIMVRGSGGYGDMLYLSSVVRGLYYRFDRPNIFVVHEHPGVKSIFEGNPYVIEAQYLPGEKGHRFLQLAAALDVFDLIADVRYAVTYATPPHSRIPAEFITEANARSQVWQKYVRRDWPYLNNIFSREIVGRGFTKYSFVEHTANLDIVLGNFGDFMGHTPLDKPVASLLGAPYVTVHHGADRNMAGGDGLQTKNLPLSKWTEIVARLKAKKFLTVQLGEAPEQLIDGVDVDLRGACTMAQTALVLRHAQAHVDTEGGLVHLARAVGTQSVVAFGPTSLPFFGYPENDNLAASVCGNCWWTTRDWSVRCPRELPTVACMESQSVSTIVQRAVGIANGGKELAHRKRRETAAGEALTQIMQAASQAGRGAVISDAADVVSEVGNHAALDNRTRLFVIGSAFAEPVSCARPLFPATYSRLPVDNDGLDWAICHVSGEPHDDMARNVANLLFEAARAIENGPILLVLTGGGGMLAIDRIARALEDLPGGRLALDIAGSTVVGEGTVCDEFVVRKVQVGASPDRRRVAETVSRGKSRLRNLTADIRTILDGSPRGDGAA